MSERSLKVVWGWVVVCVALLWGGCHFEDMLLSEPSSVPDEEMSLPPAEMGVVFDMMGDMSVVDLASGEDMTDQGERDMSVIIVDDMSQDSQMADLDEEMGGMPDMMMQPDLPAPTRCGDGVLDPDEECDDNNQVAGDGCSPLCRIEECGNNILDPGELCDGNCPVSCDDGDTCTQNIRAGRDEQCNVVCTYPRITACISGDGCCAADCNYENDNDCPAPMTPDCKNDSAWPSAWKQNEQQARNTLTSTRASGVCAGGSYPPRGALSLDTRLQEVARCLVVYRKQNPMATGQMFVSQLLSEVGRVGYPASDVQAMGGGSMTSAMMAESNIYNANNCPNIMSNMYQHVGFAYMSPGYGTNDHIYMLVVGRPQ